MRQARAHELVAVVQAHGDLAVAAHLLELLEGRLLGLPEARGEHEEIVLVVLHHHDGGDALVLLHVDEVGDEGPPRLLLGIGDVVAAQVVDPAAVREEEHVVVRVADGQLEHGVLVAHGGPAAALPATPLRAELAQRRALHVVAAAEGDGAFLVRHQVLLAEALGVALHDLRAPPVAVLLAQFLQVVADEEVDLARVGQQVLEVRDAFQQLLALVLQLLPFERGQPPQLHVEDGAGLRLRELEGIGL